MSDKKNILILTIIFIIISVILYGKTGNMLIDFSREAYIPYQMLNQKMLIKDVFLIYGAFGYLINMLLYKISININLLLIEALSISYSCTILLYFIFNKFAQKKISLIFCIFFILSSVFSHSTFGFALPYSYSTIWGILGMLLSLFALLYNKKNILFVALSIILVSKIELFVPAFLISIAYLIKKKENFKKNFLLILPIPIGIIAYLFISQITIDDYLKNYLYIKEMIKSDALKYLYQGMGSYFEIKYFIHNVIELIKFITISTISYFIFKYKPIISFVFFAIAIGFLNTNQSLNLLAIILLILIITSIKYKKISIEEILISLYSIILCSKAIFAISSISYSNFGYILIIFSTYVILEKLLNKNWLQHTVLLFLIMNLVLNLNFIFLNPKEKINTKIGAVWIDNYEASLFKEINNYLENNLKKNENFLVIPEGQLLNLIHNKPHDFYNSTFTPLDFETFKEENLLKKLQDNKPEYIIFFPRNTMEYGKNIICLNYGVDFCTYIMDNYTKEKTYGDNYKAYILKRN